MEWVEPNYNIVDIMEYETTLEKRRSAEDFVVTFFKNWESNDIANNLIVICQDLVTDHRLQRMVNQASTYSSLGNFSRSFRNMCSELFNDDIKDSYIIVLLAFSIVLDRTLKGQLWYTSSLLFTTIVDALIEDSIDVNKFDWNRCHRDILKTLKLSVTIILPPLLFFYFSCK